MDIFRPAGATTGIEMGGNMRILVLAAALFATFSAPALAHGPARQKVQEAIVIDAPAAKVWAVIKDFDSLAKWHPLVASSVADKGNKEDSTRTVVLKYVSNASFKEVLDKYDPAHFYYKTYIDKVDPNVLPVNDYESKISVVPLGKDKSIALWEGAFYRGYMLNDPPPQLNDKASIGAVVQYYRAGLENLKSIAESAK